MYITVTSPNKLFSLLSSRNIDARCLWLVRSTPGRVFGPKHCVVFSGKTLYSHIASLSPVVQTGTGEFNAGFNPAMDQHPIQDLDGSGSVGLTSCYRIRDTLWTDGPLGSYADLRDLSFFKTPALRFSVDRSFSKVMASRFPCPSFPKNLKRKSKNLIFNA